MSAGDLLIAYWTPLWNMIANTNVPGFNVSFLTFFVSVFMFLSFCAFINRIINIGLSSDIGAAIAQKREANRQYLTMNETTSNGITKRSFTISSRRRYK